MPTATSPARSATGKDTTWPPVFESWHPKSGAGQRKADNHTLSGAYVLDAVTDAERAVFAEHRDDCPTCDRDASEFHATAAQLGSALAVIPHDTLRAKVFTEITGTRQRSPSIMDFIVRTLSLRRITSETVSIATAATALIGGVTGYGTHGVMFTSEGLSETPDRRPNSPKETRDTESGRDDPPGAGS